MQLPFLIIMEMLLAQMIRSFYRVPLFSNIWIWIAVIQSLRWQSILLWTAVRQLFNLADPGLMEWMNIFSPLALWSLNGIVLILLNRFLSKNGETSLKM